MEVIKVPFIKLVDIIHRGRNVVPLKYRQKWFIFAVALVALALDNFNISGGISSSLSIAKKLDASTSTVSWVVSAYALTLGSFIILFGKLSDIVGVHRVFLAGLAIMALSSLLSAVVEDNIIAIIVFRAFQGIGGAALLPSGYALTGNYFQGAEREKALRPFSHALTASFGVGFVLGGAFSETSIGYKGFFYFTFAVATFTFIVLYFIIIPVEQTEGHKNLKVKNLNFAGVALLVIGLLLIIFGLTEAGEKWKSPKVYIPIPVGFLLLVLILLFEDVYLRKYKKLHANRAPVPIIGESANSQNINSAVTTSIAKIDENQAVNTKNEDIASNSVNEHQLEQKSDWRLDMDLLFPVEIFKIVNFFPLLLGFFWLFFSFIGITATLNQYYEYVIFEKPIMAAVKLLPHTAGLVFNSLIHRESYVHRIGSKNALYFSGFLSVGSAVWLSRLDYRVTNEYWKFHFAALFIAGYACNLYFMVYVNTIMGQTPAHYHGLVTGIFQTAAQVGVCIASAIIATMLGKTDIDKSDHQARYDLYKRFQNVMYLVVAAQATFFVMMFLVKNTDKEKKLEDEEKEKKENEEPLDEAFRKDVENNQ